MYVHTYMNMYFMCVNRDLSFEVQLLKMERKISDLETKIQKEEDTPLSLEMANQYMNSFECHSTGFHQPT